MIQLLNIEIHIHPLIERLGFDIGTKVTEIILSITNNKTENQQEAIVLPVKLVDRVSSKKENYSVLKSVDRKAAYI